MLRIEPVDILRRRTNRLISFREIDQGCADDILELQKLADSGSAQAQFDLGECYWHEDGVECNRELREIWFREAEAQCVAAAKEYLRCFG